MREIKRIFVHCTAGSQKTTLKQLENEFKAKGWKSPGYHYVVFPDGKVEQMLDESKVSNGVKGYNSTSINVAYVGGVDSKLKPVDNRTEAQKGALITLLSGLKKRYPNAHIMGHRDIWGKDPKKWQKWCPCFDVSSEYAFLENAGLSETSKAEAEYAEIGKVVPVQNPTLLLEPIAQVDTSEVIPVEEPVEEPVSHEALIVRIFKFLTSWMKKH